MQGKFIAATFIICLLLIYSCSKKHQPQAATVTATEKPVVKKVVFKKISMPVPKVIIVDDRAAIKTVDGRQYHDLEGHRYWKNYNDGKYYLFNNKMFSDSAFMPH